MDDKLIVAPFGSAERGPRPYTLLPIAVIGPVSSFGRGPDIHEMFLPYPGHEAFAKFDFSSTRSKFETLGALSIRLTMTAVGLLWLIQADEQKTGPQGDH